MPEISRFFGIIIRMFAEPAAQHRRPHFHAYYQDLAAVIAIDPLKFSAANYRRGNGDSLRLGSRFTEKSCLRTGSSFKPVGCRSKVILFTRTVT